MSAAAPVRMQPLETRPVRVTMSFPSVLEERVEAVLLVEVEADPVADVRVVRRVVLQAGRSCCRRGRARSASRRSRRYRLRRRRATGSISCEHGFAVHQAHDEVRDIDVDPAAFDRGGRCREFAPQRVMTWGLRGLPSRRGQRFRRVGSGGFDGGGRRRRGRRGRGLPAVVRRAAVAVDRADSMSTPGRWVQASRDRRSRCDGGERETTAARTPGRRRRGTIHDARRCGRFAAAYGLVRPGR